MKPFHWDKHFVTGLSSVDYQHKHLVDMVNEFGTLLVENRVDIDNLETLFGKLVKYAQYHFKEEEKGME